MVTHEDYLAAITVAVCEQYSTTAAALSQVQLVFGVGLRRRALTTFYRAGGGEADESLPLVEIAAVGGLSPPETCHVVLRLPAPRLRLPGESNAQVAGARRAAVSDCRPRQHVARGIATAVVSGLAVPRARCGTPSNTASFHRVDDPLVLSFRPALWPAMAYACGAALAPCVPLGVGPGAPSCAGVMSPGRATASHYRPGRLLLRRSPRRNWLCSPPLVQYRGHLLGLRRDPPQLR